MISECKNLIYIALKTENFALKNVQSSNEFLIRRLKFN